MTATTFVNPVAVYCEQFIAILYGDILLAKNSPY